MIVRRASLRAAAFAVLPLGALLSPAPSVAAAMEWRATVEGRLGYGTNPYLDNNSRGGSALAGITVAPTLTWRSALATTELSGSYNRDQYLRRYNHSDDYAVDLRRTQKLSAKLSATAHVGYFSSISGLLSPYYNNVIVNPGVVDQLAVGTRQNRISGDVGLTWTPTARDTYTFGASAEHDSYGGRFSSHYNYYSVTGGYSRAITARTRLGVRLTASQIEGQNYGNSRSYSPNLTIEQVLSPRLTFTGGVGAIIQQNRFGGQRQTSVSPGFNARLCNTTPRLTLCINASRDTAASGISGGLRRQTQIGADATYNLSDRSRILAAATYGVSSTGGQTAFNNTVFGNQKYALARAAYQRDITRRLAAGVSGTYQGRSGPGLPNVHALAVTATLTAKFGRQT